MPVLAALVTVGDTTDLTVPAIAAGVGVGAIAVGLVARRRGKDDDERVEIPPTQRKQRKPTQRTQSKHYKK